MSILLLVLLTLYCDLVQGNYIDAIEWYENRIENAPTSLDSIYAVIDLNRTYLLLEEDERFSIVNPKYSFKLINYSNFSEQRRKLLDGINEGVINPTEFILYSNIF